MMFSHYGQTLKMLNRRCYLECRDHLCSFQIPGLDLHRICPHFLGAVLCTPGSANARTQDCRLTIHSTLPSSHPLQRKTKGTIIRMNQVAVRRVILGLLLFLKMSFKEITTTTKTKYIHLSSLHGFFPKEICQQNRWCNSQDETNY